MRSNGCLVILCASLLGILPTVASAATFNDVQMAIIESRWDDAEQHAATLDRNDLAGDFLGIYVQAARLTQLGQCEEANALSRALLNIRPGFAPAQELIFLCSAQSGDARAAQAELASLLAILPEGPQREVLEQMLASSAAQDGPRLSGYVEVKPSSNIVRQTEATHIDGGFLGVGTIPDEARAQSGTELRTGVSLTQLLHAAPNLEISGVLKTDLSWNTASELLRPELSAELPMRFGSLDTVVFTATPFVTLGFENTEHVLTRAGVRGALSTEIEEGIVAGWSGSVFRSEHPEAGWRDSWRIDNTLTLSGLLDDRTRLTGGLGLTLDRNDEETRNWREISASLRVDHMMDMGLIVGLQGRIGQRIYAEARYPTQGDFQQDDFYSVRLELSHRDAVLGPVFDTHVRPVVFYEYTNQSSNNVFYDYQSHDIGLSMRLAF